MPDAITQFTATHVFLSNAHWADVLFEEYVYPTVEHAYQAAKTRSVVQREYIRRAPTPDQARRLGRHVRLRPDWESVKLPIMAALVRQKFDPLIHPNLAQQLLATGDAPLSEGNTGDTFWGVDVATGVGENHLGRILMEVRAELYSRPRQAGGKNL